MFRGRCAVFHGCNHSWYLFNEGMPWNPWYPSKTHGLRPARDEADAAGVVAVPHLVRDMSLAFEGRNDFWASHPPNVIRGMGNDASFCPYDLNLVDQYRMQAEWNGGYSYYNTFVSPSWLDWNHNSEYPPEVAWELYRKFLTYMANLKKDGQLEDLTLSAYGERHRQIRPIGHDEAYLAKELLYGSGKHYFWFVDPAYRVTIDATQGGSIGDLRPYAGQAPVATDRTRRIATSAATLTSSSLSTALATPITATTEHAPPCSSSMEGKRSTCATSAPKWPPSPDPTASKDRPFTPVRFAFSDGVSGELTTRYEFGNGAISVCREVSALSTPAELELIEYFKGAPGRTEYPEDLHGIVLEANGSSPVRRDFDYSGQWSEAPGATEVAASIPHVRTRLSLQSSSAVGGRVHAGHPLQPLLHPPTRPPPHWQWHHHLHMSESNPYRSLMRCPVCFSRDTDVLMINTGNDFHLLSKV